jgi:hypothetical protein
LSASPTFNALVFGASGITGWAIARTCLEYPSPTAFSHVTGLTKRPLSLDESYLPSDLRLTLKNGVDLSGEITTIAKSLLEIPDIENITHVYFTGTTYRAFDYT